MFDDRWKWGSSLGMQFISLFVSDEGVWGCFVACGTKGIKFIKGKMKPEDFESILEQNMLPPVRKQGLKRRSRVSQQN